MLTAITRPVTPAIARCELQYLNREPIDFARAAEQHRAYERFLAKHGAAVVSLRPEPNLPDSVFVEDPALVLDEVAIITRPGAASRRAETETLAAALARYRPLRRVEAPGTLEGGDVLRAGRRLFAGRSKRSNQAGIAQLARETAEFGYSVEAVPVTGCLHLKSACCYLGDGALLGNRNWFEADAIQGFRIIDVAPEEPAAANVLAIAGTILIPSSFPETAELLIRAGFRVERIDISELQKAEAGVTCSCLLFEA